MRQIADACDISVGNLTYHYPLKEDLLMLEHDGIMNAFLESVLTDESGLDGLSGYFTVECAFLGRILCDPPIARLYAQVINVPTLRARYCAAHHRLYQHFVQGAADTGAEWTATVAMSALEFELADEGILIEDFEAAMENIFRTRMMFAGKAPQDFETEIKRGVTEGIKMSKRLSGVF